MVKNKHRATSKSKGHFYVLLLQHCDLPTVNVAMRHWTLIIHCKKNPNKQKLHSHSEAVENPRLGLTALISKNQIQTSTY